MEFKVVDKYDIAIIGGGPAGISAAVEAVLSGIDNVVLFEKGDNHSTTIRKYYKDNKRVDKNWRGQKIDIMGNVDFDDGTKESTINLFDKLLDEHKIDAQFNCEITSIKEHEALDIPFEIKISNGEVFYATNVIIAIGNMGKPNKPSYAIPPSIKSLVGHNLSHCSNNEDILVVGGGDSAIEYAYYLADTNHVTLTYRKPTFTRANLENMEILTRYVEDNKIYLKTGVDIKEVHNKDGRALVSYDDGWRISYSKIVYAIGGSAPKDFLQACDVKVNEKGFPILDENHQTNIYGLYIAGDLAVRIGGSIAASINHSYKIIEHIKTFRTLQNK